MHHFHKYIQLQYIFTSTHLLCISCYLSVLKVKHNEKLLNFLHNLAHFAVLFAMVLRKMLAFKDDEHAIANWP